MDREEALAKLRAARPLLERYGVARAGLYGSTARNAAGGDSDIDLVVEFAPGKAPGLAFFDLEDSLARHFGRKVQIAGLDRMNAALRASVLRDLVYV